MAVSHSRSWCLQLVCLSILVAGCAATPNVPGLTGRTRGAGAETRSVASRKNSKDSTSKLNLSYARWQEHVGNYPEAREKYGIVLDTDPKSTDAILGLARLDQLAGRIPEAEQGFLKALKLNPSDAHCLDSAGQFYASQERWQTAAKLLASAVQAAPAEKTVRHHLAVALTNSGDVDAAHPHFVKAVGDAEADYNIGLLLYRNGKHLESEKHFLQAVLKKPDLGQAQYWLDEVRRERETKLMLAGAQDVSQRYEELPAPSAPNAQRRVDMTRSVGHTLPNGAATNHSIPSPGMATQPYSSVQGNVAPTAVSSPIIAPRANSAPTERLTSAQLEQRHNQLSVGASPIR